MHILLLNIPSEKNQTCFLLLDPKSLKSSTTHLKFHTSPTHKMEPLLTAWKEASGLLSPWHHRDTGATAMLQHEHINSLEHKSLWGGTAQHSSHLSLQGEHPLLHHPYCSVHSPWYWCATSECRECMLWSTSYLQLPCGPPSTEPLALFSVAASLLQEHLRRELMERFVLCRRRNVIMD